MRFFIALLLVLPSTGIWAQEYALHLDGDQDYLDVPHSLSLALSGAATVEAWIKIDAYPSHPAQIVSKKRRNPWAGFTLHLQNGVATFAFFTGTPGPSYYQAEAPWSFVPLGTWTHLAGVADGLQVRLFINGMLSASSPAAAPLLGSNTNPLRIGYDSEAPQHNPATSFEGLIDEVRYWAVPRSEAEIRSTMFQAVDNLPGLVSAWHLNENAADTTGGHNGAIFGDASYVVSSAPVICQVATICYTLNNPVPLGGSATFEVISPTGNTPLFVLVDAATGSVPLGNWGASQLAFSPMIFALADPTGTWGPGLASPYTTLSGTWNLSIPVPTDPALLSTTLFSEAYVLDFLAPNSLFHQSNLLTITFQM